jgi:hypothetical protein
MCVNVIIRPEMCFPGGIGTEVQRRPRLMHYHIRWSSGKVDWERYNSRAEAEAGARQLIRQEGTYQIEEFSDTACPRCRNA